MSGGKGKSKQKGGGKQSIPNKQTYQRMSYLYQASHLILSQRLRFQYASQETSLPSTMSVDVDRPHSPTSSATGPQVQALDTSARRMNSTLRNVAQRMQIRLSTDIKRSICRDCNSILQPATGNCITTITQNDTTLEITCTACNRVKRFPLEGRLSKEEQERQSETVVQSARKMKQRDRLKRRKLRIKTQALAAKKVLIARAI